MSEQKNSAFVGVYAEKYILLPTENVSETISILHANIFLIYYQPKQNQFIELCEV